MYRANIFRLQSVYFYVDDTIFNILLLCVCVCTFGEAQFLGDSACDLGGGGVAVQVHLVHTVPVHVAPAQLQTVDRWDAATQCLRDSDTLHPA